MLVLHFALPHVRMVDVALAQTGSEVVRTNDALPYWQRKECLEPLFLLAVFGVIACKVIHRVKLDRIHKKGRL